MDSEIFKAGVRPGGPTSNEEIKMLVCIVLYRVEQSMSFSQLHEALQENSLVNYFELVSAVDGLLKTGHLAWDAESESERYRITPLGIQAGEEFENSLPRSVREKAIAASQKLLRQEKRASEVSIRVEKSAGGYVMHLAIPESDGDLISFSLFVPTRSECELIRRRFLNDPLFIYKGVLALLTGDQNVLGELFPKT